MDQIAEALPLVAPPWAKRRKFDADELLDIAQAGIFREGERIELVEGEIIEMSPINSPHMGAVMTLNALMAPVAPPNFIVSVQMDLRLSRRNEPQPDLVLLRARADRYRHKPKPSAADAALVIEVSDSSLRYDREVKLPLYARHGIPEYWIVDLAAGVIEMFRRPDGDGYADATRAARGETVAPLSLPDCRIAVSDIVPDA